MRFFALAMRYDKDIFFPKSRNGLCTFKLLRALFFPYTHAYFIYMLVPRSSPQLNYIISKKYNLLRIMFAHVQFNPNDARARSILLLMLFLCEHARAQTHFKPPPPPHVICSFTTTLSFLSGLFQFFFDRSFVSTWIFPK